MRLETKRYLAYTEDTDFTQIVKKEFIIISRTESTPVNFTFSSVKPSCAA